MADEHENPEVYWVQRRRGYYVGMWWAFLQTAVWAAVEIYRPGLIGASGPVIAWAYGISGTLIVAYYSNTAIEEYRSRGLGVEHPDPARWWRHRRRGFHLGVAMAFAQTPLWVIGEVIRSGYINDSQSVVAWSYGICGTLVIAYYGNTAVEELSKRNLKT